MTYTEYKPTAGCTSRDEPLLVVHFTKQETILLEHLKTRDIKVLVAGSGALNTECKSLDYGKFRHIHLWGKFKKFFLAKVHLDSLSYCCQDPYLCILEPDATV